MHTSEEEFHQNIELFNSYLPENKTKSTFKEVNGYWRIVK